MTININGLCKYLGPVWIRGIYAIFVFSQKSGSFGFAVLLAVTSQRGKYLVFSCQNTLAAERQDPDFLIGPRNEK
jgi:hypothetical protein